MTIGVYMSVSDPLWCSDRAKTHVRRGVTYSGPRYLDLEHLWNRKSNPRYVPRSANISQNVEACLNKKRRSHAVFGNSGGGTRTPDTRIMIPLL